VVELARRFRVNERQLRTYLAKHVTEEGRVRTNLEVKRLSEEVRGDLARALSEASRAIVMGEPVSREAVNTIKSLVDSAHKLFAWPVAKAVEVNVGVSNNVVEQSEGGGAINLPLLRMSPEAMERYGGQDERAGVD
jgi:hypothetical protein